MGYHAVAAPYLNVVDYRATATYRSQNERPLICPTGNQAQQLLRASDPRAWNSLQRKT